VSPFDDLPPSKRTPLLARVLSCALATSALAFAAPSAQSTPSIEVERERLARAIALGFLPEDELAALLVAEDWTQRHLALDALGRTPLARRAARLHSAAVVEACAHERPEIRAAAVALLASAHSDSPPASLFAATSDPSIEARLALLRAVVAWPWSTSPRPQEADNLGSNGTGSNDTGSSGEVLPTRFSLLAALARGHAPVANAELHDPDAVQVAARRALAAWRGAPTSEASEWLTGPWGLPPECTELAVAAPDDVRGEVVLALAEWLRDADAAAAMKLATSPSRATDDSADLLGLALVLSAWQGSLTDAARTRLVDGAVALAHAVDGNMQRSASHGAGLGPFESGGNGSDGTPREVHTPRWTADFAAELLRPLGELASRGRGFEQAGDTLLRRAAETPGGRARELLAEVAAETLSAAELCALPLELGPDLLVAGLKSLLRRGEPVSGEALARFARSLDFEVRAVALDCARDALDAGHPDSGLPLLVALLDDHEPRLAAEALRVLGTAHHAEAAEPALHRAWRAMPRARRLEALRDLARGRRWPSFAADLLELIATEPEADDGSEFGPKSEWIELLGPLADDPAVLRALEDWFEVEVAAIVAAVEVQSRLAHDGRAATLALALASERAVEGARNAPLVETLERALRRTMQVLHPGPNSNGLDSHEAEHARPRLPKTLVALLGRGLDDEDELDPRADPQDPNTGGRGADPAARGARTAPSGAEFDARRVLVSLLASDVPRRVRTEAAIVLARHTASDTSLRSIAAALAEAVRTSEPELAVRAVRALSALPARPAREDALAELLDRVPLPYTESVRIALVEAAATSPRHHAVLASQITALSDDTVAGALLEALAAQPSGRELALDALRELERQLGLASAPAERVVPTPTPERSAAAEVNRPPMRFGDLTLEQAFVRREALLLGLARSPEPVPLEVHATVFARALRAAPADLAFALAGESTGSAEFRFRGELAIAEALARCSLFSAELDVTPGWWEVDIGFLTVLARRVAGLEPKAGARLAEAALVALAGTPETARPREGRVWRTELLVLWLSAASASGGDSAALFEGSEAAGAAAEELLAWLIRAELERGLELYDARALDLRMFEHSFGRRDVRRARDPWARLAAAECVYAASSCALRGDYAEALAILQRMRAAGYNERSQAAEEHLRRLAGSLAMPSTLGIAPPRARGR